VEWGCERLQGFLLSHPLPAEDVPALLAPPRPARPRSRAARKSVRRR